MSRLERVILKMSNEGKLRPPALHGRRTLDHFRTETGEPDTDSLVAENEYLAADNVKKDLEIASLKSRWGGVLRSMPDTSKSLKELMVGLSKAQMGIMRVLKNWESPTWYRYIPYLVAGGIGIYALYEIGNNPSLQSQLFALLHNGLIEAALIVIGVGGVWYFLNRRKKSRA